MDSAQAPHEVQEDAASDGEEIRAAEVIAALALATDVGIGVPLEHGLHGTLVAMKLAERAGLDAGTASQAYYACLLFYVGCTTNADLAEGLLGGHDVVTKNGGPVRFGSRHEMLTGLLRAMAPESGAWLVRAAKTTSRLPTFARVIGAQTAAMCEVAMMLTDQLGLPHRARARAAAPSRAAHCRGRDGKPQVRQVLGLARDIDRGLPEPASTTETREPHELT